MSRRRSADYFLTVLQGAGLVGPLAIAWVSDRLGRRAVVTQITLLLSAIMTVWLAYQTSLGAAFLFEFDSLRQRRRSAQLADANHDQRLRPRRSHRRGFFDLLFRRLYLRTDLDFDRRLRDAKSRFHAGVLGRRIDLLGRHVAVNLRQGKFQGGDAPLNFQSPGARLRFTVSMLPQTIALLAAIAYAFGFILSKRGLRYSTPITITFISLLMQTVVLFAIVFAFTGIPRTPTFVFVLFVIAGILQAVVRQLTYIGIEKIGAARSGPIRASVPLWSAAIAIFFLGEKMTLAVAAGTLLVFAGILFISWHADEGVKDFRRWYIVAPLLAAILGGVIYPLRRYALRFSDEPVYFGAVVGIVGLICTAIFIALPTTKDRLVWNRQSIGYFAGGGAFESLGLLLVLYALTYGPVVVVTPLTATLPLWVVLGSKLFLRDLEKITPRIVAGAALVVAGTIAISLSKS